MAGVRRAVLIAGPTASGKSAMALQKARETGAIIVNTDALQVYGGLRLLTARPSDADLALAPHRLYGEIPPQTRFSTGDWARAAAAIIGETDDLPLIFVGGTGLYFETLTKGFAEIPDIPAGAVAWAEAEVHGLDRDARGRLIANRDPVMAGRLKAPDPQRVVRALAVLKATGRSLASYQDQMQQPLLGRWRVEKLVLSPDRDILRQRIATRFETMLEQGAIEEVRDLLALNLDPSLPVMKAIGVREIGDWLAGRSSREAMLDLAITATRQYAKRQRTWFRNRMSDWSWI